MIKEQRIYDEDGKGYYTMFVGTDFEYSNPIDFYSESFMRPRISLERDLLLSKKPPFPIHLLDDFLRRRALVEWNKKHQEILATEVPENFISLLQAESKGEQVKLLNGSSLTPDQLIAFIFRAWTDFGFSFSQYSVEHHHKGLDESALPKVIHIREDKVESIGDTSMSSGQLKQVIEQRKVIVSKFFDNGSNWHCFFTTFRSLRGEENWNDGQPHFHYISDKFGISREDTVNELKSKDYKLGNLPHIELLDYGQQPSETKTK